MASTVIQADIAEDWAPILGKLFITEVGQVAPDSNGYSLTLDANIGGKYTFTVPEACVGIYRVELSNDVGAYVGQGWVWIEADDTNTYVASNDFVSVHTYKLLNEVDTNVDEILVDTGTTIPATLATIDSCTSVIGSGTVTINAPVADDGGLLYLVIGDDYLAANGRALEWTFDEIAGITASAVSSFGLKNPNDATDLADFTGTVTDLGSGTFKASVEINDPDLVDLAPGYYDWSLSVVEGGTKITIAQNLQDKTRVQLLEKFSS
jgi:hypothetical protein